jgi:hypothetical protein
MFFLDEISGTTNIERNFMIGGHWMDSLKKTFPLNGFSLSSTFTIPEENRTIRAVTDLRKLNLLLKISPISYSKDCAS